MRERERERERKRERREIDRQRAGETRQAAWLQWVGLRLVV
jgi:hypothetical protein